MSESKRSKTKTEKPKEEKKVIEEELTKAATKQEQTEQQLQRAKSWTDFLEDNERRRWFLRLVIKGGIIEDIAPSLKYCTDQEFYELMDYVFPFRRCRNLSRNGRKPSCKNRITAQQALAEIQRVPVCLKRRFRCAA